MIALLSATALALSGCQQDSGPSPGAGSSGSNATPSESPSPSQSTPPAPSGPPFVSGPSSGEGGALGATMVKRIRSGSHNGFDRSSGPGTGSPSSGGFSYCEVLELLEGLAKQGEVVGMDLVEVAPAYDPTGITAFLAAQVLLNFLGFIFEERLKRAGRGN